MDTCSSPLFAFKQLLALRSGEIDSYSRQFLEFALGHPYEVAFGSLTGIANKSGVAPSTAVKAMRFLGFENFRTFRDMFREDVRMKSISRSAQDAT